MNRAADDLISRAVLIDELMAGCMPLDLPGLSGVTGDELTIRNYIDSAPAVDAAPVVHGMWIFHDDDIMPWISCSECGICTDSLNETSYCPRCGAKMETKND